MTFPTSTITLPFHISEIARTCPHGIFNLLDYTPKAAFSAINVQSAIPDPTPPCYKSRVSLRRKMRNSTWESVSHMSTKQRRRFRDQKFVLSGGMSFFYSGFLFYFIFSIVTRRVTRSHGSSGVVKSKFLHNLPPRAFGASVRVVRLISFLKLRVLF